jgi:hypothetical protein
MGGIDLSPPNGAFGSVPVGQQASMSFTVTNLRTTPFFAIGEVIGQNAGDFDITGGTCAGDLAPNADCRLDVIFKPLSGGPRTANLFVGSPPSAIGVLTGTGVGPAIVTVSPSPGLFGTSPIGGHGQITFTVTNATAAAVASTPSISGPNAPDFVIFGGCLGTLPAGSTCTVQVEFNPHLAGPKSAVMSIGSPAVATVNFSGTATGGGTPVTLSAQADTYTRDGANTGVNFGASVTLEQKNSTAAGNNRRTFVRFPITSASTISSAKLRLHGSSVTTAKLVGVFAVASVTWNEATLTGNTPPPTIGTKLGSSQTVALTAGYVEWDVTSYVQAQKNAGATAVSFEVKQDVANNEGPTIFSSREAATNRPQLVVTP